MANCYCELCEKTVQEHYRMSHLITHERHVCDDSMFFFLGTSICWCGREFDDARDLMDHLYEPGHLTEWMLARPDRIVG